MFVEPWEVCLASERWKEEKKSAFFSLRRRRDVRNFTTYPCSAESRREGIPAPLRIIYQYPGSASLWCVAEATRVNEIQNDWRLIEEELSPILDGCTSDCQTMNIVKQYVVSLLVQFLQWKHGINAENPTYEDAIITYGRRFPSLEKEHLVQVYDASIMFWDRAFAGALYLSLGTLCYWPDVFSESRMIILPWSRIRRVERGVRGNNQGSIRIVADNFHAYEFVGTWNLEKALNLMQALKNHILQVSYPEEVQKTDYFRPLEALFSFPDNKRRRLF